MLEGKITLCKAIEKVRNTCELCISCLFILPDTNSDPEQNETRIRIHKTILWIRN